MKTVKDKLTIAEIEYLYALAEHKTDEQLADLIRKPVALVQMQLSLMANLPKRPWEKETVRAADLPTTPKKVKVRSSKKATEEKIKAEKKKQSAVEAVGSKRKEAWKKKNDRPLFKNKEVDLSGKVAYRLNYKTIIYGKPGLDIAKLRKKYNIA